MKRRCPTIAAMLKRIRAAPFSRREIAEELGVTERSVANWLTGRTPRPEQARAIRMWYRRLERAR